MGPGPEELDETPQVPSDHAGIYCRSWCPLNPRTNEIVFPLLDETAGRRPPPEETRKVVEAMRARFR
jgi:hypothetical protein